MGSERVPPSDRPEAVVLCGIQGSGKTTFYRSRFAQTHTRINLDDLRTRRRERDLLMSCVASRRPFVVDNTNPTPDERAVYVQPALAEGFRLLAFWLDVVPREAIARNAGREGRARIPVKGILGTHKRLVVPKPEEGFEAVFRVVPSDEARFSVALMYTPSATGG